MTPLGAAGALSALSIRIQYPEDSGDVLTPLADLWIARHGLLFAARAAVEQALLGVQEGERVNPATYGDLSLAPVAFGEAAHRGPQRQILLRVRAAIAVAPDAEYAELVEALRPYRDRSWSAAVATSVLLPGERDWVEQDVRTVLANGSPKPELAALLLLAAGTAEQARALAPHLDNWWSLPMSGVLATLADGLGPGAAGAVLVWFDVPHMTAESQQRMLSVLTDMDDDAVFAELLARLDRKYVPAAVLDAAARFPARAMRLFAEAGSPMLRAHVLGHLDLVDEVLPSLGPAAAERVRAVAAAAAAVSYAPIAAVPPVLSSPPWLHRAKPAKPVVIAGLSCDDPATLEWRDGERDRWLDTPGDWGQPWITWEEAARCVASGSNVWFAPMLFTGGPEELVRPLLPTWQPERAAVFGEWVKVAAARFGLAAQPLVQGAAERSPALTDALLPYSSLTIVVFMADRYTRVKSARAAASACRSSQVSAAGRAL
ncbi:molybdate metabolism regulator, partial [Actinoplanes sp. NPDC048791]